MRTPTLPDSFVQALRASVDAAGGQSALARKVGVSQPTLWGWLNGARISAEQAINLERAAGIPCHVSRPDIFLADPTREVRP